jgi:serine/threonine-protein kinase
VSTGDLATAPTLVASSPPGRAVDAGDRLAAGTRAGEYVVERFLGAGAMGEVYAGTHPLIGKRVAIKVLRRELAADAEAADRFLREARAAGQIEHPNVVDVFAFGRVDDGRLYLVMDLVDGDTLRARLAGGALPARTALAILAQLADALDAAHARGVVHRDLKPDNVVMAGATPKILDFGLAKLVSTTAGELGASLTARGTWLGTPGYMAPEQWSADGATAASDRYALGVIAFELLAGRLPFDATNIPQMMEQHFRAAVPPLTTRGGTTTVYDAVLARALAKDPEARFATARDMVAALAAAAGDGGRDGVARGPERRRGGAWLPAVAAAGVLGAGVAVVAWGHDSDPPPATSPPAATTPSAVPRAAAAPPDRPHVHVTSEPAGAHVLAGGRDLGIAPIDVDADSGGVEITVHAPGFGDVRRTVTPGAPVSVTLAPVDGFAGVWRLPSGELRAFAREHAAAGDAVVVDKLDAVTGPRTFFRRYEFADAAGADVAFAAVEETSVPRPDVADCRIPLRVEYRYRAADDALELRRERVAVDDVDGHCVARDRAPGDPEPLVRVDRARGTPTWVAPPAGGPPRSAPAPRRRAPAQAKNSAPADLDLGASNAKKDSPLPATNNQGMPVNAISGGTVPQDQQQQAPQQAPTQAGPSLQQQQQQAIPRKP